MKYTILDIEEKFGEELSRLESWAFLRNYYQDQLSEKSYNTGEKGRIKELFSTIYGRIHSMEKVRYIFLSDSGERRRINDYYYGTRTEPLLEELGSDFSLLIETPFPVHFPVNKVKTRNIISRRYLDFWSLLFKKVWIPWRIELLENINNFIGKRIDYNEIMALYRGRYIAYKNFFSNFKLKALFVSCYYCHPFAIEAFKELGGKLVVEIQHGVVGYQHYAYHTHVELNKKFLPDYFFSFGLAEKDFFAHNGVIDPERVIPVGSYYVDWLNFVGSDEIIEGRNNYKKLVGVSLQAPIEEDVITFVIEAARRLKDVLFVLVPRVAREYHGFSFPSNVIVKYEDCYKIVMKCDFHLTAYSTCAIEMPSLGVPNILFDIGGMAKKYYRDILSPETSIYVNGVEELVRIIKSVKFPSPEKLKKLNAYNIIPDCQKNLKKALEEIGL